MTAADQNVGEEAKKEIQDENANGGVDQDIEKVCKGVMS